MDEELQPREQLSCTLYKGRIKVIVGGNFVFFLDFLTGSCWALPFENALYVLEQVKRSHEQRT